MMAVLETAGSSSKSPSAASKVRRRPSTPVGVPGAMLAGAGILASIGSAATDGTAINELLKNGSQLSAAKFFTEVLGHTPSAAARTVALIDLSGGWDAFVQRLKTDFGDTKK